MTFKQITAAAVIGVCAVSAGAAYADDISVIVDGTALDFTGDQAPVIVEDRTLVPVRAIFEALGADVQWDEETQTVLAAKDNDITVLQIGSPTIFVNSTPVVIDVPAQIIGDRTMVPVRAVSEAFSCSVEWDQDTYTVTVISPDGE